MSKTDGPTGSSNVVPFIRSTDIYLDAEGNKIVEPIFNGSGGTVVGNVAIKR